MDCFAARILADVLWGRSFSVKDLFSARSLGVSLWIGLALLTLSLFVLMRTRWGQARPLSKCVVLSVFAHILLIGYAYGTRLILDSPPAAREDVIDLTFVAEDDRERPEQEEPDLAERPWEILAPGGGEAPEVDDLQRRDESISPPNRRPAESDAITLPDGPPEGQLAMAEPIRPMPGPPQADFLRASAPGAGPTPVPVPSAAQKASDEPIQPDDVPLERLSPARVAADALPRTVAADTPAELIETDTQVQRLAELPEELQQAEARPDSRDRIRQADNDADQAAAGAPPRDETQQDADGADRLVAVANVRPVSDGRLEDVANPPPPATLLSNRAAPAPVSPRRLGDGEVIPKPYRHRLGPDRMAVLQRLGGNSRTESAVEAALQWLARNQSGDGRWDPAATGAGQEAQVNGHDRQGAGARADTGITALALLAFLGAGHTHLEGPYRATVQRGLEFLLRSQREDGCLAGSAQMYARMYCHGMASIALSEAYVLTGDYRLRPYIERAVRYTVEAQDRGSGGWRYQPGDRGDMSQFGWQVMALRSAELGGVDVPFETRQAMIRFLHSVSSGSHQGLASYRPGERPSRTMTAEALTCRVFLELDDQDATIDEAADYVLEELPGVGQPNLYYWYYATLAMFQLQDQRWRRWNQALQQELLGNQSTDGPETGSWDANTVWGRYGGRVYSTSLATLCLEVYYRYLPLCEQNR